jgi:hypothetical protein
MDIIFMKHLFKYMLEGFLSSTLDVFLEDHPSIFCFFTVDLLIFPFLPIDLVLICYFLRMDKVKYFILIILFRMMRKDLQLKQLNKFVTAIKDGFT